MYCAVVLDTYSRKVVGWSIDAAQTATLVTNALSMAATRWPTATHDRDLTGFGVGAYEGNGAE